MIDPTEDEIMALEYAGQMGGEYLDSLGKTDLAVMSVEEWMTMIEAVVTGYQDRLHELASGGPNDRDGE